MMLKIRHIWKCGCDGIYFNSLFCIPTYLTQIMAKKKKSQTAPSMGWYISTKKQITKAVIKTDAITPTLPHGPDFQHSCFRCCNHFTTDSHD
jgi:hypothetical protein